MLFGQNNLKPIPSQNKLRRKKGKENTRKRRNSLRDGYKSNARKRRPKWRKGWLKKLNN
jgi:hypothetical protein